MPKCPPDGFLLLLRPLSSYYQPNARTVPTLPWYSLCKCTLICPSHTHTVGIPLTLEFCLSKTRSKRSLSHAHTAERVGWWVWFSLQRRKKGKALHPIWGPHSWTCSSVTTGYTRRCVCKAVKERRRRKEVSRRNLPFCLSACTNTSSIFYWCDASIFFSPFISNPRYNVLLSWSHARALRNISDCRNSFFKISRLRFLTNEAKQLS